MAAFLESEKQNALRSFIDKLHSHQLPSLQLPEIIVVGETSSGKSSLLSALSGVELPSAAEMCTRCPTRLVMEHDPSIAPDQMTCEVSIVWSNNSPAAGQPNLKRSDVPLAEIPACVSELQAYILKSENDRCVSPSVVKLRMRGKHLCDLTLTDLPGIIRTPTDGQPADIGDQIWKLVDEFGKNERCIIVGVHTAGSHINNSILQDLRAKYDKSGKRIFPVLTKADLVDRGSEDQVIALLNGDSQMKGFPIGFHLIRGRGQKERNEGVSIVDAIEREKKWFRESPCYGGLINLQKNLGSSQLKEKLSQTYLQHITTTLPKILSEIQHRSEHLMKRLEGFEDLDDPAKIPAVWMKICRTLMTQSQSVFALKNSHRLTLRGVVESKKEEFYTRNLMDNPQLLYRVGAKISKNSEPHKQLKITKLLDRHKELAAVESLPEMLEVCDEQGDTREIMSVDDVTLNSITDIKKEFADGRTLPIPQFDGYHVFLAHVQRWVEESLKPTTKTFVDECLKSLQGVFPSRKGELARLLRVPPNVAKQIDAAVVEPTLLRLRQRLEDDIHLLLNGERHPTTANHYFSETIRKRQRETLLRRLLSKAESLSTSSSFQQQRYVSTDTIEREFARQEKCTVEDDAVQMLTISIDAYIRTAAKAFTDSAVKVVDRMFDSVLPNILQDQLEKCMKDSTTCTTLLRLDESTHKELIESRKELNALKSLEQEISNVKTILPNPRPDRCHASSSRESSVEADAVPPAEGETDGDRSRKRSRLESAESKRSAY